MKKIAIIILLFIIAVCGYKIYLKLNDYKESDKIYSELQQKKSETDSNNAVDLSDINEDYICWINIENTNIDYPIVQSKDNSYYLHRDIYKNYLYAGTIFLDYRCDYRTSKNLVIYGHNMKNKTIFSQLEQFKDESFFKSNPEITLSDKNGSSKYEVFAVILVPQDFDYIKTDFENSKDFSSYLDTILAQATYKSENLPEVKDRIITLSTCSYEFKDARTVVFAKKL